MARQTPARGKNGRFLKRKRKSSRKRATSSTTRSSGRRARNAPAKKRRKTVARKRAPARRKRSTRRRRNPALVSQIRSGFKDALGVVVGKAGARLIPTMVPGIPKTGAVGLLVQAAAAVAVGYVADRALGRDVARQVLAGGLSAPLETAIVAYRIPILGPALDPVTQAAAVAATTGSVSGLRALSGGGGGGRLASYVTPNGAAGLGAYANGWQPGM